MRSTFPATSPPSPPTLTVSYTEYTAAVTINTTTEATAVTIVTAPAFTPNGSDAYWIEFFSPMMQCGGGGNLVVVVYDGAASIGGVMGQFNGSGEFLPTVLRRRLTPSNASHTYGIRAYEAVAAATVNAGVGGAGVFFPGYLLIAKAT